MSHKIYVIGIGYKPLEKRVREILIDSLVILASNRLLEVFKRYEEFEIVKDKIKLINNVDETIEFIRAIVRQSDSATEHHSETERQSNLQPSVSGLQPIILLASGDPMFFGIGRRAVNEFGKELVEILPDLSSIQVAFSRIKDAWDDAFLMSLHGGPDPKKRRRLPYTIKDIPFLLQRHNKIAILTDKENNPSEIANVILKSDLLLSCSNTLKIYVCERLGYPDEKITVGTVEETAKMTFSEPNVVIIQKKEERPQKADIRFGLKEDQICHSRGLITKDEVRAVSIHKLRLPQKGIVWDIGAGSGAVSIEVARLNPCLKVFAIEKDKEQIENIRKNKILFDAHNIEIIEGIAPEILKDLPQPDRIFIGGSGNKLSEIIDFISHIMEKGIVVLNAVQIETLNGALDLFSKKGFSIDVIQLGISRMKNVGRGNYLSALNPVFVITAEK